MRNVALVLALMCTCGCTHAQLRRNTVRQAQSVADIYQQQVMDNLAKFAYDYNSLPHFSTASGGTSQIQDQGTLSYTGTWISSPVQTLNPQLQRQALESWTMLPVSDPRKLELMRCAFQTAIAPCLGRAPSGECPGCSKIFNHFYMGDPSIDIPHPNDSGYITSKCIDPGYCWLGIGCEKCAPKNCGCTFIGRYCGTCVWVLPGGQDELTKLTIAILDYAIKDPAPSPPTPPVQMKTVVSFFDSNGAPTTRENAVREVMATIPATEPSAAVVSPDIDVAKQRAQQRLEQVHTERENLETEVADTVGGRDKLEAILRIIRPGRAALSESERNRISALVNLDQEVLIRVVSQINKINSLRKQEAELQEAKERLDRLPATIHKAELVPPTMRLPERRNSEIPGFGPNANLLLLRQQLQTLTPPPIR